MADEFLTPNSTLTPAATTTGPFWQKLLQFVLTVATGGTGKIKIPVGVSLPTFNISDTIDVFGKQLKVTLSSSGSTIVLQAGPA